MTLKRNPTRFDNWDDVNICNHCEHYYTSACDGLSNTKYDHENTTQSENKTVCKAFTPTRRETLEKELKDAQKALNSLWWAIMFLAWFVVVMLFWMYVKW